MKKSLVALAVLATSGAALAQVSVSGKLMAGFQQSVKQGIVSSGLGVDTAEVTFSATEDLGSGMKAGASMGLVNVVRGAGTTPPVAGENIAWAGNFGPANSSVFVSGDFGRVTLSTARSTDYLTGGVAFVGGTFQDGRALSNRDVADSISWAMPVGPVAVSLTYSEPNNYLGLGAGTSGAENKEQSNVALGLRYTDGPLVADFGYAMYDEGQTPDNTKDKTDTRVAGSYDFGAFKVGGGWRQRQGQVGSRTDMGFSAAVPMGALTLGANWVQRDAKEFRGTAAANSWTNVGYGLSATYALSKRTAFIADYTAYTGETVTAKDFGKKGVSEGKEMNTVYNLLLSHSF